MPITDTSMYRSRDDILADLLAQVVAAIPDAYTGEDGALNIILTVEAGQLENLYLAHQLLLEDQFITTASFTALQRHGEVAGLPMSIGTKSSGNLAFTGDGGTYIPVGSEAAYDPGGGLDPIYFLTTADGTIPNPGSPSAPTAAIHAASGNLNGLYEWVVTFITASGETLPSALSNAISPVSQYADLTIPLGGTGTTARKLYRRKNGTGNFQFVGTVADNTTTAYTDNATDAAVAAGSLAPSVDTAHSISIAAESEDIGAEANVGIGAITILSNSPSALTSVTNPATFTGGSDQEDTEDYRVRLLAYRQNPQTGSPADLKSVAENVAGVDVATVFENTPAAGQTTIRISGPGGSVPSGTIVANVQAAIDTYRFANMQVTVTTFTQQPTNVTVDVTASGTYTLADVTPSVVQALTDYINGLAVGETLKISGIIDAVFGLAGVDDVVVTTPSTNQTTAADTKRTPGTLTVT